ncbi:MAG: hypothetical protein PHQ23_13935, partial [Candidatus Wallbacteria bacterium]|nr:hypothetical protein [Candidatus Wallbacteria bacterium]
EHSFKESLAIYAETGNELRLAHVLIEYSHCLFNRGNPAEASAMAADAAGKFEKLGCWRDAVDLLVSSGKYGICFGDFLEAASRLEQALKISREIMYREGEALAACGLAEIDLRSGDCRKSLERLQVAESYTREAKDHSLLAFCLTLQAEAHLADHCQGRARACCIEALRIADESGNEAAQASARVVFAKITASEGDLEGADKALNEAEETFRHLFRLSDAARVADIRSSLSIRCPRS